MSLPLRELYRQDALPIFQNRMYETGAEARRCPTGDVRLVEDAGTGLVYNAAFRAELVRYDASYQNEQAVSPHFAAHLRHVADLVGQHLGSKALVEIGCGKGTFLELMLARGADMLGFDPIYEGSNPRIRAEYFADGIGIVAEGLILRHVLEHIPDPVAFLHRLRDANGGRGLIYIEVPCFDWICHQRAWFDIFYEHINYFRLSDFHRMFGRVLHAGRAFGDQYLTIVADLASLRDPRRDPSDAPSFPPDFTARLAAEAARDDGPVVVWGGASKGVIFALLRERAGRPVARVIDISPAKQGKFLPATGLPVMSPEAGLAGLPRGSRIHVMNPNYLAEVSAFAGPDFDCVAMTADTTATVIRDNPILAR
jgi:hypothetical protein